MAAVATTQAHVHSFNQLISEHLSDVVRDSLPYESAFEGRHEKLKIEFRISSVEVDYPCSDLHLKRNLTPRECRLCQTTYSAPMNITFKCEHNDGDPKVFTRSAGKMPIMILSNR